jgi:hypothetical protein
MSDGSLVPDETQQLVEVLITATDAGRLEWTKGSDETEFVLVRPNGSIVLSSRDKDGQQPFVFRVLDPEGVEVEGYTTYSDADMPESFSENIGKLYETARRSGVKASRTVKDLLQSFEQEMP